MSEQMDKRQHRRELLITVAYTVFSVLMIIVTAISGWPVFYIPLIAIEVAFIWWSYISKFQTYVLRAFIVTAATCVNILLYGIQGEGFAVLIPTLCVEFVLLSLYEMTQIMTITVFQTVILFLYQALFNNGFVIPDDQMERNRLMLQMVSFIVLIALCIYRIRHHAQEEDDYVDLENRVRSEQKIKDDFMANTSHELRTPINTVSGMCEILLQKDLTDEVHNGVLDIQMTGVELQSIVTDIMDYAALEADTMELVPRAYSITSTLNDVMNMTVFENRDKQLEIIFDCDPNIPRLLEGDEHQLRRILNNLISNAIKFTSEGGVSVKVSYRPEEYGINLIVSVKDTGVGIGMEEQEIILRGFYQTDSERNSKRSGMGLGLTISSALVKKMGGFLTVKSQIGKGSEFSFAVPQKVIDEKPCISLDRPGMINLIWYYRPKSPVPSVRDAFVDHIKHFSDYFGIVSQQAASLDDCKRRVGNREDVHLILGKEEYLEDKEYFDVLSEKAHIILVADRADNLSTVPGIHVLYKPYNAMMLAEIFNGRETLTPIQKKRKKNFTAPTAKIMVVDDNLMNLKVVEGMLRKYKIKIVAASSGEEALNLIDSQDFDFVFMDHMMPGMDGVECFHHIRGKDGSYFAQVPIIALTANAIAGSREMFLEEGFNDFIAKPVDSALMNEILLKFIPENKLVYEDDTPVIEEAKKVIQKDQEAQDEREVHRENKPMAAENIQRPEGPEEPESPEEPEKPERPEKTEETKKYKGDEIFDNFTSFDRETALMYCGTVEDFTDLAEVFCDTGRGYADDLRDAMDNMDFEKYRITSHTVKSTSRTLGFTDLSDLAMTQETAARDENEAELRENHEEFCADYIKTLDELDRAFGREPAVTADNTSDDGDNEIKNWETLKSRLKRHLDAYESGAYEDCLDEFQGKLLNGIPVERALSGVTQKASNFDFEGAIEELDNIGGKA